MTGQAVTIGDRIAQLRRELAVRRKEDVTRADLAKLVGVTPSSVGDWERNISAPKGANLVKLAKILHTTEDWIVNGTLPTLPVGENITERGKGKNGTAKAEPAKRSRGA